MKSFGCACADLKRQGAKITIKRRYTTLMVSGNVLVEPSFEGCRLLNFAKLHLAVYTLKTYMSSC